MLTEWPALVEELKALHGCHSLVLYGSRAHGTETPASDIDIVCFGDFAEPASDCRRWRDYWLDAWLYPTAEMHKPEDFLHLSGGRVLAERDGLASRLIEAVDRILAQPPEPLKDFEARHLLSWLRKTLERIRRGDPEAWFRRYWMSAELLENYCRLKGARFLGFKRSLNWVEAADPDMHRLFLRLYSEQADFELMEKIVNRTLELYPSDF